MHKVDMLIFLLALLTMLGMFTYTIESSLLCRQAFGGVWSSIVIDDCFGSFWTPTNSTVRGVDGWLHVTSGYLHE